MNQSVGDINSIEAEQQQKLGEIQTFLGANNSVINSVISSVRLTGINQYIEAIKNNPKILDTFLIQVSSHLDKENILPKADATNQAKLKAFLDFGHLIDDYKKLADKKTKYENELTNDLELLQQDNAKFKQAVEIAIKNYNQTKITELVGIIDNKDKYQIFQKVIQEAEKLPVTSNKLKAISIENESTSMKESLINVLKNYENKQKGLLESFPKL